MLSKKAILLPSASPLYFSMYVQSISSQRFSIFIFFKLLKSSIQSPATFKLFVKY